MTVHSSRTVRERLWEISNSVCVLEQGSSSPSKCLLSSPAISSLSFRNGATYSQKLKHFINVISMETSAGKKSCWSRVIDYVRIRYKIQLSLLFSLCLLLYTHLGFSQAIAFSGRAQEIRKLPSPLCSQAGIFIPLHLYRIISQTFITHTHAFALVKIWANRQAVLITNVIVSIVLSLFSAITIKENWNVSNG